MDYTINILIASSFIFVGVLIFILGIPLFLGRIKMNRIYGARFKKSFESDENWYKINKYSGKWMMIWSIPITIIGVICFFIFLNIFLVIIFPILFLLFLFAMVYQSYKYSRKL